MSNSPGQVIDQACTILSKTYKELVRLKDDCASLLLDREPSLVFDEEYSYGGKSLHLRDRHTFLFRCQRDDGEASKGANALRSEEVFVLVCIFRDTDGVKRVSLKDEPELWAGLFTASREGEKWRPWEVADLLNVENRSGFVGEALACDGQPYEYHYVERGEQERLVKQYDGCFVGCPLTDICDRQAIQQRLLEPLFSSTMRS